VTLYGYPILQAWNISKTYIEDLRADLGRDTPWEWFQWLAERVKENESSKPAIPAHIEFKNWRKRG